MKNLIEKIRFAFAGCTFLTFCVILFCIDSIHEYLYKTLLPKKWERKQEITKKKIAEQKKNLSRGWAYQPNLFGEH